MKTLKLDIDELANDFYSDARIFGIISTFKNYKLCWKLNKELGLHFRCNPEIEILLKKKDRSYYFPVYQHNVKDSSIIYYLYTNSYEGEFLLPELKNVDFICLVKDAYSLEEQQWQQLLGNIRSIGGVQMVSEITLDQVRNKMNLIF